MGFFAWIICIVIASIVLRYLRSQFEIIDIIFSFICFGIPLFAFVYNWIYSGFWSGVGSAFITGIACCILAYVTAGMGSSKTKYTFGDWEWEFECSECHYEKLDVTPVIPGAAVVTTCKRCGHVKYWKLNNIRCSKCNCPDLKVHTFNESERLIVWRCPQCKNLFPMNY